MAPTIRVSIFYSFRVEILFAAYYKLKLKLSSNCQPYNFVVSATTLDVNLVNQGMFLIWKIYFGVEG